MVVRNVKRLEMRLCLSCGHAGYCDSSKISTELSISTGHLVIKSAEPVEKLELNRRNTSTVMIFQSNLYTKWPIIMLTEL
jgi:hypothetical protein